jgi:hypothetical protein
MPKRTHTTQTNAHNTMLHHHHMGEELKSSRRAAPSSPTLCHDKSRNPLQPEKLPELPLSVLSRNRDDDFIFL